MRDDRLRALTNSVDNYFGTVIYTLALAHEATWDQDSDTMLAGAGFRIGRRMTTSASNAVSPSVTVTPDLLVQRTPTYGLVCEAKTNLPRYSDDVVVAKRWGEMVDQLRKYDDDLVGWLTDNEKVKMHDVVLLVDMINGVDVADFVTRAQKEESHKREPVVIGTERSQQGEMFVLLSKERGTLQDAALDEGLRRRRKIPFRLLEMELARFRFCDSPPQNPLYTVQVLWDHLFPSKADAGKFNVEKRVYVLDVTVKGLTRELQTYYGWVPRDPRDVGIPRAEWVMDALDFLAKIGDAEQQSKTAYRVFYTKSTKRDTIVRFAKKMLDLDRARKKAAVELRYKPEDMFKQGT